MVDLITLQTAREVTRLAKDHKKAVEKDLEALKAGRKSRFERVCGDFVTDNVELYIQGELTGLASATGRKPAWYGPLADLDAIRPVSVLAIRAGFSCALRRKTVISTLIELGKVVERASLATKVAATETAKTSGALQRAEKALKDAEKASESSPEAFAVLGQPLWNALVHAGILCVAEREAGKDENRLRVELTGQGLALFEDATESERFLLKPTLEPMLCPPRPWVGFRDGGFLTREVGRFSPLVRKCGVDGRPVITRALKSGTMADCIDAINIIQEVPYRINADALWARTWVWEKGLHVEDHTPLRAKLPIEEVPFDIDEWEAADRKLFWQNRSKARRVNDGVVSGIAQWVTDSAQAEELAEAGVPFYLPHFMDFRGRVYPASSFSHHRSDSTKALVEFSNGKPLGRAGLRWLKIHVANCGDFEKISKKEFDDREAWADANRELLEEVSDFPHAQRLWLQADAPFSFFAAVRDLVRALRSPDPEAYVSHIPVALDGCNSGVQHYSAILRADEGFHVGLSDAPPQDLYALVARECARQAQEVAGAWLSDEDPLEAINSLTAEIKALLNGADEEGAKLTKQDKVKVEHLRERRSIAAAVLWHREGITRSTVKRPVMTFGYSAKAFGFSQQIQTDLMDPLATQVLKGFIERHPFGIDDGRHCAAWLGKAIFAATKRVLPKVSEGMEWLQHAAAVLAHEGLGVSFDAPDGFPVVIITREQKEKRLHLVLLGISGEGKAKAHLSVNEASGSGKVDKSSQQSSVSPNVIHACDAAHLRAVARELRRIGITDMLLIHDSFATHACDVGALSAALRVEMVSMYDAWSPLVAIWNRARDVLSEEGRERLKAPPENGGLDLFGVLGASYSFS